MSSYLVHRPSQLLDLLLAIRPRSSAVDADTLNDKSCSAIKLLSNSYAGNNNKAFVQYESNTNDFFIITYFNVLANICKELGCPDSAGDNNITDIKEKRNGFSHYIMFHLWLVDEVCFYFTKYN